MAIDNRATSSGNHGTVRTLGETAELAVSLLPAMFQAGVVSLEGPMGAGKTHFVKAVSAALGITDPVTSPTYTLLHSYSRGEMTLQHSDWYRLESEAEAMALGLEESHGEGLLLIEWGDKFPAILPPGTLRVRIDPQPDDSRLISWSSHGD